MESFIQISTFVHVLVGFMVLILGPIAFIFKKNYKVHRLTGRMYMVGMTIIFLTAVPLSVIHQKWFLLFIAFFTYYSVCIAYRAIKIKKGNRKVIDWVIDIISAIANTGLLVFGLYVGYSYGWQNAVIPLIFGVAGVYFVASHIITFLLVKPENSDWLQVHIGNILGSYIGAVTAFTVNQAWKWDVPDIIAWLGPSLLLVPVIVREIAKTKRPKGDLSGT
jgi:uncharacterized membrane protein